MSGQLGDNLKFNPFDKLRAGISNFFLDLLFPRYCVNCGEEKDNSWLCYSCEQKIVPVVSQICPQCEKLSPGGYYHLNCRKDKFLKGIIASAYFEEGPVREMIHNFKYNGVTELAEPLAGLMIEALAQNFQFSISNFQSISNISECRNSAARPLAYHQLQNFTNRKSKSLDLKTESIRQAQDRNCKIENYVLTFVPIHWQRQAKRGYNQAEILAKNIGANLGIEVIDLLKKPKKTIRQAELSGKNRRKNLRDVFILKPNIDIRNRKIIIVDDVTTTGSTLNECGRVLKTAGAKEIWGLVIARG